MQVPTTRELLDARHGVRESAPRTNQARGMSIKCSRMLKAAANRRVTNTMIIWHLRRLVSHTSELFWAIILAFITPAEHQILGMENKNEPEEGRYLVRTGHVALRGYLYWLRAVERTVTHYFLASSSRRMNIFIQGERADSQKAQTTAIQMQIPMRQILSTGAVRSVKSRTPTSATRTYLRA